MTADTKKKLYILLVVLLSLFLLIALIMVIFYHSKLVDRVYNTNLGESLLLEVKEDKVTLATISYPNNLVNGLKYKQKVNIIGAGDIADTFVRAKVVFADYNNVEMASDVEIVSFDNWYFNQSDGYYYLKKYLKSEDMYEFIKTITIPSLAPKVKNNAVLSIVVESLKSSKDVLSFWNAPIEWTELLS